MSHFKIGQYVKIKDLSNATQDMVNSKIDRGVSNSVVDVMHKWFNTENQIVGFRPPSGYKLKSTDYYWWLPEWLEDNTPKDLEFLAEVVTEWPDSAKIIRLYMDGEVMFHPNKKTNFYPQQIKQARSKFVGGSFYTKQEWQTAREFMLEQKAGPQLTTLQVIADSVEEWPEYAEYAVVDTADGENFYVAFTRAGKPTFRDNVGGWTILNDPRSLWVDYPQALIAKSTPTDWNKTVVSKAQWEIARYNRRDIEENPASMQETTQELIYELLSLVEQRERIIRQLAKATVENVNELSGRYQRKLGYIYNIQVELGKRRGLLSDEIDTITHALEVAKQPPISF